MNKNRLPIGNPGQGLSYGSSTKTWFLSHRCAVSDLEVYPAPWHSISTVLFIDRLEHLQLPLVMVCGLSSLTPSLAFLFQHQE